MKKLLIAALLALFALTSTGCIVVPVRDGWRDGPSHHHHYRR